MQDPKIREWKEALVTQGVRITPQREAVLRYLSQTRSHPTAAEVFQAVRKVFPHISRATVYNTLNLMSRLGLITELRRQDGSIRYETNQEPHVNLICVSCGRVFDWDAPISLPEERPKGFALLQVRVDAYGYCPECLKHLKRADKEGA